MAKRDLGFSLQNSNSIKYALKREKSQFQRGIWNAQTYPKVFRQDKLNKPAESVVKENFGGLRERTSYYRIGEIMSYASTKYGPRKDRNYSPS